MLQQNCEKTTPISSTTNEWSQNQIITIDDQNKSFNMASSSSSSAAANKGISTMEKTNGADPHQQPLKCPRCDSSNTKFCYYNNYSLSQPRHFCKACKRYWTRGGTLRNVPVGGGCRKNKRVKRSSQPSTNGGVDIGVSSSAVGSVATANPSSHVQPPMNNPLFYNLPTNPMEMSYPFSRFGSTRVSSELSDGFDLQRQMNGVGLGFDAVQDNEYNNGFRQIHDHGISTSRFMSSVGNNSINPSTLFGTSSTMASLLASSLQHQKFGLSGLKEVGQENHHNFPGLMPYDQDIGMGKEVKNEGENRYEWNQNNNNNNNNQNILGQHINSSDSSSLLWNTTNGGGGGGGVWFDPSNIGSSVPSLI